jgi:carbamoyl-phosphate synthase large subunit
MKNNIFVSGASGIVGYGILKSLKQGNHLLYSSSIYPESIANYFADHFKIAPRTDDASYASWLSDFLLSENIDLAYAGIDLDMYFWSMNRNLFKDANCKLVLNNQNLISLCQDKWNFYEALKDSACKRFMIDTTLDSDYSTIVKTLGNDLIIKPRLGFGSKGVLRVKNEAEFDKINFDGEVSIVQEFIGSQDAEYTVAAFGDGNGGFFNMFSMKRKLATGGYTDEAEVVENELFEETVTEFCKELKPVGPTNFQFRISHSGPKLLEINPRLSSSSSIRAKFGYNEAQMCIDFYLREKAPKLGNIRKGKAIRYIEEYIVEV